MITPSYSLTANSRISPRLAIDFTTASLDSRITFTRTGNTATVTDSSGTIVAINADLPRFDYDPTTLVCKGLLIEDTRINILLNSLLNGTNLATQSVTVSATAYTLSFYGTGSITLSGTASATVNGTGAYPSRQTYTFTPTAGTLTLTVSGTVQYAQLETGSFASSFIPTAAASVTRNPDVAKMTGTNFSNWYNATEGAFFVECSSLAAQNCLHVDDTTNNNRITMINRLSGTGTASSVIVSGVSQADLSVGGWTSGTNRIVSTYKANSFAAGTNAATIATDTSGTVPTVTQLRLGGNLTAAMFGYMRKFNYYPQRITNAEVQAFSK